MARAPVNEPRSHTAEDTLAARSRDRSVVSGGHLVASALRNEGVDTIFTLCGGHVIDIYDGCIDHGIRVVDVRHEQVAAHAADGYARQTGRLGCVVTTAGPGFTNALTGIATAFRSESPVLHIGGQGALTQHKMGSLQDLPHVDIAAPITKFSAGVRSTERIADMVAMAARECFAGAPGPSYLEIPRDVLDREVPVEKAVAPQPGGYRASTRSIGDPADVERLAEILVRSERPAVLLGSQVWTCRGHEEAAAALFRSLDAPCYMNGAARGILPPGDPHCFNRTRADAFDEADVIVVVGTPFDFRMGYGRRLRAEAAVVHIDMDYRTVARNRDVSLGLVGDPGAILEAVHAAVGERADNGAGARTGWLARLRGLEEERLRKLMPLFRSDANPIHPYRVAWELNRFLTEDTIYIGDGGDVVTISAQAVEPRAPRELDGPGRAGVVGRRHRVRVGLEAGAPGKGSPVLLWRRLLRHDRLRHGDGQPVRRSLYRGHRQQLGHEPDPLRPARQVRRGTRQRGEPPRRRSLLEVRRDAGRIRRGGHRLQRGRAGAGPGAAGGADFRQVRGRQRLGGRR